MERRVEWEYLEFDLRQQLRDRGPEVAIVGHYGGEEYRGLLPFLNRLGEHGWELVTLLIVDTKTGRIIGADPWAGGLFTSKPFLNVGLRMIVKRQKVAGR